MDASTFQATTDPGSVPGDGLDAFLAGWEQPGARRAPGPAPEGIDSVLAGWDAAGSEASFLETLSLTPEFQGYMQRRGMTELPDKAGFWDRLTEGGAVKFLPYGGTGAEVLDLGRVTLAASRIASEKGTDEDYDAFFDYLVEQERGSTFMGGVGELLGMQPAFWGEIATGTGLLSQAGKRGARLAAKTAIGRAAKEFAERSLAKSMAARATARVGKFVGGAVAASEVNEALMEGFGPGGRMELSTLQRSFPALSLVPDGGEGLRLKISEPDRSYEEQEWAGRLDLWLEFVSERSGAALARISGLQFLKAKAAERLAGKMGFSLADERIPVQKYRALTRAMADKTWWHGPLEEVLEERFGDFLRAGLGGLADMEEQGDFGAVWPGMEGLAQELIAFSVPGAAKLAGRAALELTLPAEGAQGPTVTRREGESQDAFMARFAIAQQQELDRLERARGETEDAPAEATIGPEGVQARVEQGVEALAQRAKIEPGKLQAREAASEAEQEVASWGQRLGLETRFVEGLPEDAPRATLPGEGVMLVRAGLPEGAEPGGLVSTAIHEAVHDIQQKDPRLHRRLYRVIEQVAPEALAKIEADYEGQLGSRMDSALRETEGLANLAESVAPWIWWAQADQANRAKLVEALKNDRGLLEKLLDALKAISNRVLGTELQTVQARRLEELGALVGQEAGLEQAQVAAMLSDALSAVSDRVRGQTPSMRPFVAVNVREADPLTSRAPTGQRPGNERVPSEAPQRPQDRTEPQAAQTPAQEPARQEAAASEAVPLYEGMPYAALNRQAREMGLEVPDRKRATLEAALRRRFEQRQAEDRAMREARREAEVAPAREQRAAEPREDRPRRETPTRAEQAALDFDEGREMFALAPPPGSDAFKRWFGDSKVVDADGKPLVVYHGTSQGNFSRFSGETRGMTTDAASAKRGFFFVDDIDVASAYAALPTSRSERTNVQAQDRIDRAEAALYAARTSEHRKQAFAKWVAANEAASPLVGDDIPRAQSARYTDILGNDYALRWPRGAAVLPVYLSLRRPLEVDQGSREYRDKAYNDILSEAKRLRRDGAIIRNTFDDPFGKRTPHTVYIAFAPEQIKSAIGNVGTFDPANPDIRFALARIALPEHGNYFQAGVPSERGRDAFYSFWVNRWWPAERALKALNRDDVNALEMLRKGVTKQRLDQILRTQTRMMRVAKAAKIPVEFVSDWLYATHAAEANAVLAERNPTRAMLDAQAAKIQGDLRTARKAAKKAEANVERVKGNLRTTLPSTPERLADQQELAQAKQRLSRANSRVRTLEADLRRVKETKPFKGTEEERNKLSGMSNAEAQAIFQEGTAKGWDAQLTQIRSMRDALNRRTRRGMVRDGLVTQEEADAWERMYPNYMPKRTYNEDEVFMGIGRNLDIRGRETKVATGRKTKADNPLAFLFMQAEQAAIRGEKNRVGQKFLDVVEQNPDPSLWNVDPVVTRRVIDPATGFVKEEIDRGLVAAPNVVAVKRDGKAVLIQVQPGHLAIAAAFNGANVEQGWKVVEAIAPYTRLFAALATRWNPFFWPFNMARDVGHGTITAMGEHGFDIGADMLKGVPGAFKAMLELAAHPNRHVAAGASKWLKYAKEYRDAGGMIAFLDLDSYEDVSRELARLSRGTQSTELLGALRKMGEAIGALNDAAENSTRLSYYAALRERGFTVTESARRAKDLTTNFERKGNAAWLNSLWAFSNAGLQGVDRVARAFRHPRMWQLAAASVVASGMLVPLNLMVGGDDEDGVPFYWKVPEYIHDTGQVFMLPGGGYVVVPLPWVYRWIHNIGRKTASVALGGMSPAEAAVGHLGEALAEFNPLGGEGDPFVAIMPTLLRPVLEGYTNTDWTGKPVRPTKFPGDVKPMSETAWPDPTPSMQAIARLINRVTGGDEVTPGAVSISPDTIEHVLRGYLPGVGAEAMRLVASVEKVVDGQPTDVSDIPILRRVYKAASPHRHNYAWKQNADDVRRAALRIQDARESGDRDALNRALEQHGPLARLDEMRSKTDSRIRKLKAALKLADEGTERHENLQEQLRRIQVAFNTRYHAVLNPPQESER